MRIGEVATAAGVSTRALRHYEEHGLLGALRSPTGQRHYPEDAVERVRLIQQLYAAGLSSRAIAKLLPCVDTGVATPAVLAELATRRDRIQAQLHDLGATLDRLDAVIAVATHPSGHCAAHTTEAPPARVSTSS